MLIGILTSVIQYVMLYVAGFLYVAILFNYMFYVNSLGKVRYHLPAGVGRKPFLGCTRVDLNKKMERYIR